MNPYNVVRDFENAVAEYTGAEYAVAVSSCTAAIFLCCKYLEVKDVSIPRFTYCSVPQQILHAGGKVVFRDERWSGGYQLSPYPIWDFARRFTSGMYVPGSFQCVSFHASKILGIEQGGMILHDDRVADAWFRRARFDGRSENIHPKDDKFIEGWHCYMSPSVAAQGLLKIYSLPKYNADLLNSDYPDLSLQEIFR